VRRVQETARFYGRGLNKIKGFSCRLPKGAFYVFPNIKETGWPSKKLADALLDDAVSAALSGPPSAISARAICVSVANSIENTRRHSIASAPGRRKNL